MCGPRFWWTASLISDPIGHSTCIWMKLTKVAIWFAGGLTLMYLPPPLEFHKPSFIGVLVSWRVAPFQHEAKSTPFLELRVGKNASSVRVCMQFGDLICSNRLLLLPSAHFSEICRLMPFGFSLSLFKSKHEKARERIQADAQERIAAAKERTR